jgi:hypothetical protein
MWSALFQTITEKARCSAPFAVGLELLARADDAIISIDQDHQFLRNAHPPSSQRRD